MLRFDKHKIVNNMRSKSIPFFIAELVKARASLQVITNKHFEGIDLKDCVLIQQGSSSLDHLSDKLIDVVHTVEYGGPLGFHKPTTPGHPGKIIFGFAGEKKVPVILLKGRMHLHEGYSAREVAWPILLFGGIGIKKLILTNASGSTEEQNKPGTLGIITDHFNYVQQDPFTEGLAVKLGRDNPFVAMDNIYDKKYIEMASTVAKNLDIPYCYGKYLITKGPSFETEWEVNVFRNTYKAEFLGMSTVIEASTAQFYNMRVLGLTGISNYAYGIVDNSITHEENLNVLKILDEPLSHLINHCIPRM